MGESVSTILKKPKRLTLKQAHFFRELVRTRNATEAAMRVYNCKSRASAQVVASQLIKHLGLDITELMNLCGLDTNKDVAELVEISEATKRVGLAGEVVPDFKTRIQGLIIRLKLKGHLREQFEGAIVHKHVHFFQGLVERSSEIPTNIQSHIEAEAQDVTNQGPQTDSPHD